MTTTSLLHLPLFLVPGLVFAAIAVALRAPIGHGRLVLSAVAVAAGVGLVEMWLGETAGRLHWPLQMASWLEALGGALVYGAALRWLGRLPAGKALVGAAVAAGLEWAVSTAFAFGLGSVSSLRSR